MITAKNINKSYGTFQVLKDISIDLNPGEITVLFGPSGCGKTTLLRNLSLLDYPDSGELKIFERDYKFPLTGIFTAFCYPHLSKFKIQFPVIPP